MHNRHKKRPKKCFFELIFTTMQNNDKRLIQTYQRKYGKTAQQKQQRDIQNAVTTFEQMPNLLMSAYNCWNSLQQWRTDTRRREEFTFGDQWADRVYDYENKRYITERMLLVEQGLQPSQYNIIRNIIRTIAGVWVSNKTLPVCVAQKEENQRDSDILTATLHALYRKNELAKLDYSLLVQIILSGLMATDNNWANRDGDSDVVNDFIDPFTFFVDNNMKDPRYNDCTMVGYFKDMPVDSIAGVFSGGNKQRAEAIRNLYRGNHDERIHSMSESFTDERLEKDFFTPGVEAWGLGRVIVVQRKETAECYWVHDYLKGTCLPYFNTSESEIKQLQRDRIKEQAAMGVTPENMLGIDYWWSTDSYWVYYWLTPYGDVLEKLIQPYWHNKPSIIFELHEFFVGKIYPFATDLIDTQKQINKLSAISELLSKHSAKDTMFIPINTLADEEGYGIDYIEHNSSKFGKVVPYKPDPKTPGVKPEHYNTVAQAFTPLNIVNMYLKLSENVSGVFGALQGASPTAGTPAQMYAQQSQNSATSLNGLFESANSFRQRRDKMNVQLIQQFYKGNKYVYDKKSGTRLLYEADKVKNIEFEVNVVENTDTPAYRLMVNDLLFQLKQYDTTNMLDLRGLLEAGNLPFKEQILDYLNKREQEAAEAMQSGGQMPGAQLPPELQQQLGQYQFNPQLMAQFGNLPPEVQQEVMANMQQPA